MAVLMLIFMICALRTNVVYTLIFLSLLIVFLLLSSAYWTLGEGSAAVGARCVKVYITPDFFEASGTQDAVLLTFFPGSWSCAFCG